MSHPPQEGRLKVTLGSCLFLVFLFAELPLVGSKVINLFSNKGFNVGSNLEAVATELLSRLCVINYGLFPIILAPPGVILGLPPVASPVLDVYAIALRWQIVHDPFSLFASRTTLFPLLLLTRLAKRFSFGDSRPNLPNTPILPLAKT